MTDLTDVSPGDTITSERQNLINDYIQDGTHAINTLSLNIQGTEVISSTRDIKGATLTIDTDDLIVSADKTKPKHLVINSGTSAPASPETGSVYYNTSDKRFYIYDGTNWEAINMSYTDNNILLLNNSSSGTTVTSSTTADTYGSYVEVTAATSNDILIDGVFITVEETISLQKVLRGVLAIATGASGSESIIIENPFALLKPDTDNQQIANVVPQGIHITFPVPRKVSSGTRISVAVKDTDASSVDYYVWIMYHNC